MAGSPKKRARNEALGLGKLSDFKITPPGIEPPTREAFNGARAEIAIQRDKQALESLKRDRGRPTRFTQALANDLLQLVSSGMPIDRACKALGLPRTTLQEWMTGKDKEGAFTDFREALARAREDGGEALAGEALRVARETYEKEEVTSAQVQSATLYTNVLKWYAGTLNTSFNPNAIKHLEITGKDGAPLNAPVVIDARSLPDDQREAVRQALLAMRGDSAKTIDG
jgi:hypothetical protein